MVRRRPRRCCVRSVREGDGGVRAATGDVNRARLRELGFDLGVRSAAGVSDEGAWFATAPGGAPVVLKWFPDEIVVADVSDAADARRAFEGASVVYQCASPRYSHEEVAAIAGANELTVAPLRDEGTVQNPQIRREDLSGDQAAAALAALLCSLGFEKVTVVFEQPPAT